MHINRFDVTGTAFWVFKNFWDVTLSTQAYSRLEHDYFELRTDDRYLSYPANYSYSRYQGSTDSRKKLFVTVYAGDLCK